MRLLNIKTAALLLLAPGLMMQSSCGGKMTDGQRAMETVRVQNTMSKHAHYHAAGKHVDELNAIRVSQEGPYAATAK